MCFGPKIKEIDTTPNEQAGSVADTAVSAESATPKADKKPVGRSSLTIDIKPTQSGTGLNLPV